MSMRLGYAGTVDTLTGSGDVAQSIEAAVDKQWSTRRSVLRAMADGSRYFYVSAPDEDRLTFNVGAFASYQFSRRAVLTLNERVSSGYARQATAITEAKALFPNAVVRTNNASGGLAYEMSRRDQIQVSATYDNVLYDSTKQNLVLSPSDAALLVGGGTFSSRVSLSRLLTHADSVGVSEQYSRSVASGGEQSTTYTTHATWQRPLAAKFFLSAEGGVDAFQTQRLVGIRFAPTGSATVARRTRRGTVGIGYARTIEVLGATHVSSSINPSYSAEIGRRLNLNLTGTVVKNTFPADPTFGYSAKIGTATFAYRFPGNLIVAGGYSYFRRESLLSVTRVTYNSSLSLSYGKSWY